MNLISVCIPCKNRTYDLNNTLPSIIDAANASPPVEIVILNYNSKDDLDEYIKTIRQVAPLERGNTIEYFKYTKPKYYNMAHAYNLNFKLTKGDYVVILGADIVTDINYFKTIRENEGADWMHGPNLLGIIVVKRDVFETIGGYDERFEYYGPEDKDIEMRLKRLGGKFVELPDGLISEIRTPDEDKLKYYDPTMGGLENRERRRKAMKAIYEDNRVRNIVEVNVVKEWGKW